MNTSKWKRTAIGVAFTVLVGLLPGCGHGQPDVEIEPGPVVSGSDSPAQIDADVRPIPVSSSNSPSWEECTVRVRSGKFQDELEEQDAWLETAQRLEDFLKREPRHAGALRDLIVAYVHLLSLESETLGADSLCLQASRRVSELESRCQGFKKGSGVLTSRTPDPFLKPDDSDLLLVDQARQLLFAKMQLYPCVCDLGKKTGTVPRFVSTIGQDRFEQKEEFQVGALRVHVYQALGQPPNPGLLWGETYFVLAGRDPAVPEDSLAYVVARQGETGKQRYYLCFRSPNQSHIVSLLGNQPPTLAELRSWIEKTIHASLEARQGGDPS